MFTRRVTKPTTATWVEKLKNEIRAKHKDVFSDEQKEAICRALDKAYTYISASYDTIDRLRAEPHDVTIISESAEWKAMHRARAKMSDAFVADLANAGVGITEHVGFQVLSDLLVTVNDIYKIPDGI